MIKNILVFTVCLISLLAASAQIFTPNKYPKGYFTWPVQAKRSLVANFGELRPNHYHMGLDCRTDQRENMPVLAAANGYIAKVKIEPFGFGRCIYINHPNGLTTLYAHLNEFNPALEKYVTEQQYLLESWKIFIDIPAGLFPVNKGQFIAYSGNTGGSQGPHVHFEIRDTKTDKVLNPLLFGFPVPDNVAPSVMRLAVYDRTKSTYEQSPRFIPIKKVNGVYVTVPATLVLPSNKVSFAIAAVDRSNGSSNPNGIFEANLFVDDQPVIGFQLDSISYDETRYLNAHIDYKLRSAGGPFVQHLSRLPGYKNGIYKEVNGDGVITIDAIETRQIKIDVSDTEGNKAVVQFAVKSNGNSPVFTTPTSPYLFKPGYVNVFENDNVSLYLPETHLYDSFYFKVTDIKGKMGEPAYQLQSGNIPVQAMFPISIKNTHTAYPDKMVMHRWWGSKDDYAKAVPVINGKEGDWYKASFRALGNVELLTDIIPPTIRPVGFYDGIKAAKLNRIAFVVLDNTEELMNFQATLDGRWLRFSNDKGKTFIYKFDEHCPPGSHELKISVEDCVGNKTERLYRFTR